MDKNSSTSNSNKRRFFQNLPLGLLLFLLMAVVTEGVIFKIYPHRISHPTHKKILSKKRIAQSSNFSKDLVVFGDSSAAGGVYGDVLQENTNLSAFNFSLVADATMAGNYYLLNELIANNRPPKYVLLMNVYDMWWRNPNKEFVFEILFKDFNSYFRQYLVKKNNHITYPIVSYLAHRILPSLVYRFDIQRTLQDVHWIGNLQKHKQDNLDIYEKLIELKGSSVYVETMYETIEKDVKKHMDWLQERKFNVSHINRYYWEHFVELTKKHNITVLLSYPPLYDKFYKEAIHQEHYQEYVQFIENIVAKSDHVVLLTKTPILFDINDLSDRVDHLAPTGAISFTKSLAELINQLRGTPEISSLDVREFIENPVDMAVTSQ